MWYLIHAIGRGLKSISDNIRLRIDRRSSRNEALASSVPLDLLFSFQGSTADRHQSKAFRPRIGQPASGTMHLGLYSSMSLRPSSKIGRASCRERVSITVGAV